MKVADIMNKSFLKLSSSDTLSQAIGKMRKADVRTALVFFGKQLLGVVARRELLMGKMDASKAKLTAFVKSPPVIDPDTDLVKAAELLYHAYPTILVVKHGKKLVGIVSARDFIYKIKNIPKLAKLKVSQIMSQNPIVYPWNARLGEVLHVMRERHIGRIPVVDEVGRLVGILSFTDIMEKYLLKPPKKIHGRPEYALEQKGSKSWIYDRIFQLDINIGDEASHVVITAKPGMTLKKAIDEMYNYKISDLVVTRNNKPVGIITTRDLLETFVRLKEPEYWPIQIYGVRDLKPFQQRALKEAIAELYEKIRRAYFRDIIYFLVHVKPYEEGFVGPAGRHGRTKWAISIRLATPAHVFTTKSAHFHFSTAYSEALKEMERVLQDWKTKTRERWQETGKKGRRAMFEHFIRRQQAEKGGLDPYSPLIKR